MIRFFTLTLAVSAMFISFADTAQSGQAKHLVISDAKMARTTTPEIVKQAPHVVTWQYKELRENTHHRGANKVSKSSRQVTSN